MTLNHTSWQEGQDNPNSRLSNMDALHARIIRHTLVPSVEELARLFGIGRTSMSLLLRGITYKDAGGPIEPGRRPPGSGRANPSHKKLGERNTQEEGST